MEDDVTIVVMTRDRAGELRHSLPRHEAPVIVVDNGSTDGTADVAREAGARLIRLPENRGAAARNIGVREADTPYVAFADDDSWWAPGALRRAARTMDAYPRTALVTARVLVGEDERLEPVSEEMARSPLGHPEHLPGRAVLGFLACAALVRRDAFLDAGGFSGTLHFGGEEELLALDLASAGWGLAYLPELVVHHHPSSQRPDPALRLRRQLRNRLLTAWLRRPLPAFGKEVLAALATPDGRGALADAARTWPSVARDRRRLPPEVERARAALDGD